MRDYAPFILALGALTAAFGGCSSPETSSIQSVLQDACAAVRGEVPYDVTYTVSFTSPDGAETVSTWDMSVNDNSEYHAVISPFPTLPGYPPAMYSETAEMIGVGGAIYLRTQMDNESFGTWQEVSEFSPAREICAYIDAPESQGAAYTDLGSTTLDSAEVRHIRYEAGADAGADGLVEEFWITPAGQIKQHQIDFTLGEFTSTWLGVLSGVGEPNIITRPTLPTPSPALHTDAG